jgi:hypothetical protein
MTKEKLKDNIDFSFFCAQDSFLSNGEFIPMLDISFKKEEGTENTRVVIALAGEAVDQRLKILYSLGAVFGNYKNKGKVKQIENILMINEAWASILDKGADVSKAPMPSKDPNKIEILVCVGQTPDGLCLMKGKEIKRILVEEKQKIDLVDMKGGDYTSVESNLLQKFYDGYNGVVSKGIIFKDEDMPMGDTLKKLFKN